MASRFFHKRLHLFLLQFHERIWLDALLVAQVELGKGLSRTAHRRTTRSPVTASPHHVTVRTAAPPARVARASTSLLSAFDARQTAAPLLPNLEVRSLLIAEPQRLHHRFTALPAIWLRIYPSSSLYA